MVYAVPWKRSATTWVQNQYKATVKQKRDSTNNHTTYIRTAQHFGIKFSLTKSQQPNQYHDEQSEREVYLEGH